MRPLCGAAWAPDSRAVLLASRGSRQLVALYFTQQPPGLEAQIFPVSLPASGACWASLQHIMHNGCKASPCLSIGLPCQHCHTCSCCDADAQDARERIVEATKVTSAQLLTGQQQDLVEAFYSAHEI